MQPTWLFRANGWVLVNETWYKGIKLGNLINLPDAGTKGRPVNMLAADTFAANILLVRQMQVGGARTLAELATGLNNRGVQTARGVGQ